MLPEEVEMIFDEIANGKSLRAICVQMGLHKTQVLREIERDSALSDQYARARERMAEHFADEMIEIADNSALTPDDRRVRNDARKWAAGKMAPKKYGDRVLNEHTGKDGGPIEFRAEADAAKAKLAAMLEHSAEKLEEDSNPAR